MSLRRGSKGARYRRTRDVRGQFATYLEQMNALAKAERAAIRGGVCPHCEGPVGHRSTGATPCTVCKAYRAFRVRYLVAVAA